MTCVLSVEKPGESKKIRHRGRRTTTKSPSTSKSSTQPIAAKKQAPLPTNQTNGKPDNVIEGERVRSKLMGK
ncbi:hypothetical protein U1Q18_049622 [Sarracenia purpurea var. burkii]